MSLLTLVQNPNVFTNSKCVCRPWSTDVSNKAETTERGYIVPLDELTQQAGCLNEKVKAREVSTPTILTSWTRLPRSWSWPKRSKLWTKWCFESTILSLPSGDEDGHIANLATQGHNVVLDRKPCCGYNYADWLLVVTCTQTMSGERKSILDGEKTTWQKCWKDPTYAINRGFKDIKYDTEWKVHSF